jgi:threonine-phosphate decarboxylase
MTKHQHGGDTTYFSKQIGCKIDEVIDLSSNINFIRPQISIDFNTLDIASYPNYNNLANAIGSLYKVSDKKIELFNGATTAIYTLFRELSLNLKHCTLYAPLYLEYEKSAKLNGYTIKYINRFENIYQEVQENSFVVFVNPSTPDGQYYDIKKLMNIWIEKNCTILIDESFLDFTPFQSAINYLESYNKLYILKSMTKFYSSAGIRIGALISQEKNIKAIQEKEPLWKISQFDSEYLQSALADKTFPKISKEINGKNKKYLISLLKKSSLIEKIYPSDANFIMIKLRGLTATEFQNKLIEHKIMIRNCSNFKFLDDSFVRIAVKDTNKLKALEDIL